MWKNFKGFDNGKEFLLARVKRKWHILNLNQLSLMKQCLTKDFSEEDLRTIRASINASYQKYSNFTPLGIFLTIFFTGSFSILSSFAIAAINFGTNIYVEFLKGNFKTKSDNSLSVQFYNLLQKDFKDKNIVEVIQNLYFSNLSSYFKIFGIFLLLILIAVIIYYLKFNRISKLKFLLDEAVEEKARMQQLLKQQHENGVVELNAG